MGLDMYLEARKHLSAYDWETSESKKAVEHVLAALDFSIADMDRPSVTVTLPIGYWRKANQIHNWFVQNVQEGNDDCRDYYVSRENLVALKETCEKVLDDKSLAEELLPTSSGFFFGSTDYDEYYEADLRETIRIVDRVLQDSRFEKDTYFSYQASW